MQLGFDPMTDLFWNETLFEKPDDRDVVCHASAWDMMGEDDFRYIFGKQTEFFFQLGCLSHSQLEIQITIWD